MPKVSEQYRDARREQILDAARRCFLRSGFQGTSMQDLFAEAGLSSGAVYRYFASKDEMILAIAQENMSDVLSLIRSLATDDRRQGIGAAIAEVLRLVHQKHTESGLGQLSVIVWSEAMRNPSLKEGFAQTVAEVRNDVAQTVREYQARGGLPAGTSAEAMTALFISVVPGFILQLAMFGDDAVAGVEDAIATLWPVAESDGPTPPTA